MTVNVSANPDNNCGAICAGKGNKERSLTKPIFILGPTGTGKSELALEIAKHLPCEIISVDSAMVYSGMTIGTATPTPEQCKNVPYRLTGFVDPANQYSAGAFCEDANHFISEAQKKEKLPLLVGGSMFYFHALEHGLDKMPASNIGVREKIQELKAKNSGASLYRLLLNKDPETAAILHPHDSQRIKRALEVCLQCDVPMSKLKGRGRMSYEKVSPALKIALKFRDIHEQRERLSSRFDQMLRDGLVEEVCELLLRGDLDHKTPAIRSVGYRQVWQFLCGKYDYENMREKAITATMQLVKRQKLWLKKMTCLLFYSNVHRRADDIIKLIKST